MLANHSAAELAELQALYELSPWGEERSDVQAAMICAAMRTSMGDKDVWLKDWIYEWDKPEETTASMMERARRIIGPSMFEDKRHGRSS